MSGRVRQCSHASGPSELCAGTAFLRKSGSIFLGVCGPFHKDRRKPPKVLEGDMVFFKGSVSGRGGTIPTYEKEEKGRGLEERAFKFLGC